MEKDNKHTRGFFRTLGWIIVGTLVAALFAVVLGALVMVLWNWLMPEIFGLGIITYWQGFGIALLAKLLFGGFGHNGEKGPKSPYETKKCRYGHRHAGHMHNWRFDDVYEDWWEEEGAQSFEEFMKKSKESKQDSQDPTQNA